MPAYRTPIDIANRGLQLAGGRRMTVTTMAAWAASTDLDAAEAYFAYDKRRQYELRRNLWVAATRTTVLRALDTTTQLLSFGTWNNAYTYVDGSTGYPAGYVVMDTTGQLWVSLVNANTSTPGVLPATGPLLWDSYFGTLTANVWNDSIQNTVTTNNTSYSVGEIVYYPLTNQIWVSIVQGNQNDPTMVDTWASTTMYPVNAVVSYNGVNYQSLVNQNFNFEPDTFHSQWTSTVVKPLVSGSWIQLDAATLSPNPIVYPLTCGPASDLSTRNAFRLPAGFLRPAPQSPKAGVNAWFGAHVGLPADDWTYSGLYLTTGSYRTAIGMRFIADITDVGTFDPMFSAALGAGVGVDIVARIADGSNKARCDAAYAQAMFEARTVDAIETGPVEQDEDEYITCRR